MDEVNKTLKHLVTRMDSFQESVLKMSKEVNSMKSRQMDLEVEFKQVKKDLGYTHQRMDMLSKTTTNNKHVEMSSIYRSLNQDGKVTDTNNDARQHGYY
eukprot:CAMPEP_0116994552 /NCGR_PEP_ID=MMETSP0467-20121206/68202_1 /TAXON_ID=283647 /ORGANISM="Mesodinium pulex, Strain SPMC105" /LENGTH=98 /DNA_ID=CAMNT_0004692649 /DNA_START=405 /DNA_END=701 /DNA_ORIENTATION=-